jgi:hypothetical protein
MCTELILAVLYFFILFFVNFFLYKLLKNYFQNILYLLKIKNIFTIYKNQDLSFLSLLYFSENLNYRILLKNSISLNDSKDIILIGNSYKFLQKRKNNDNSINYYLELLKQQYLSKI